MRPYVTEAVTACIQATQYIYYLLGADGAGQHLGLRCLLYYALLTRSGWCWPACCSPI